MSFQSISSFKPYFSAPEKIAELVRNGLIDHLLIVIAPLLAGGKVTSTLLDGNSFQSEAELMGIKSLKLTRCEALKDLYIHLEHDVIQNTIIDSR